jgi:hypothetical protein
MRCKLAVEFAEQRNAVCQPQLRACRSQSEILRRSRAVDDEARSRKRLEHRPENRIAVMPAAFSAAR